MATICTRSNLVLDTFATTLPEPPAARSASPSLTRTATIADATPVGMWPASDFSVVPPTVRTALVGATTASTADVPAVPCLHAVAVGDPTGPQLRRRLLFQADALPCRADLCASARVDVSAPGNGSSMEPVVRVLAKPPAPYLSGHTSHGLVHRVDWCRELPSRGTTTLANGRRAGQTGMIAGSSISGGAR
jgi:hypothetical protein